MNHLSAKLFKILINFSISDDTEDQISRCCITNNANCDFTRRNNRFRNNNRTIPSPQSRSVQNLAGSRVVPQKSSQSWNTHTVSEEPKSKDALRNSIQTVPQEPGTTTKNKDTDDDYFAESK